MVKRPRRKAKRKTKLRTPFDRDHLMLILPILILLAAIVTSGYNLNLSIASMQHKPGQTADPPCPQIKYGNWKSGLITGLAHSKGYDNATKEKVKKEAEKDCKINVRDANSDSNNHYSTDRMRCEDDPNTDCVLLGTPKYAGPCTFVECNTYARENMGMWTSCHYTDTEASADWSCVPKSMVELLKGH
jgi:hypothetical protein